MKIVSKIIAVTASIALLASMSSLIGCGNSSSSSTSAPAAVEKTEKITYEKVTCKELSNAIEKNAARAEKTYQDKYVKLTGKISNFDSDGAYIGLENDSDDEWSWTTIQIYLPTDEMKDEILNYDKGDTITIKGQITDIGELLGYQIDADKIVKK